MTVSLSPEIAGSRVYTQLRRQVETVLIEGRRKVEVAWVQTYHETGRLIHTHVLKQRARADYGASLYAQLSADTGVSVRTLHECVQFYRLFPIARPVAQFGWNRCRLLCQIGDEAHRAKMVAELARGLTTVELKDRVRSINADTRQSVEQEKLSGARAPIPVIKLLKPRRGTPDVYRLVARDESLAVDVGFKLYLGLNALRGRKTGDLVMWREGEIVSAPEATTVDLFTFSVTVRRVIDGDTLLVSVALPHYVMDEKLRLRGLDCPEMDTPAGQAAKRYTATLVGAATEIIVTTSKVDKYDRYLADVHLRQPDGTEIHLNNALLRAGHAVPMGAEEMTAWVP